MISDQRPAADRLDITDETIRAWLRDGRTVTVPLAWYPRLCHGTPSERNNWELVGNGTIVRWPDLDEDISIGGLITGPSRERSITLGRWLLARQSNRSVQGYEIDKHEQARRAT